MIPLVGALVGAGIWLVARGLVRRPVPLLRALGEYQEPDRSAGVVDGGPPTWRGRAERRALQAVESFGIDLGTLAVDLRTVGRSPAQHAFAKLSGAVAASGAAAIVGYCIRVAGLAAPV